MSGEASCVRRFGVREGQVQVRGRIQFENIPSWQQYLSTLISCMRDGVKMELAYHSFWSASEYTILLEPYFVKVSKQRWYAMSPFNKSYIVMKCY